jgi:hypothetical protein
LAVLPVLGPVLVDWLPVLLEAALPAVLPVLGPVEPVLWLLPVLLEAALPAVLPVLGPVEPVLLLPVLLEAALPAVLPVLGPVEPVLLLPVLLEAALLAVLPVLGPVLPVVRTTVGVVPFALPVLALTLAVLFALVESPVLPRDAELPVLFVEPVLPVTSSWCLSPDLTLSSPLPLLPPATSPRESEFPSSSSLWLLPLAATAVAPLWSPLTLD